MGDMTCLVRPFECTGELTDTLYTIAKLYAAQIILITFLSAVTIYRREMSCNHVYVQDEEDHANVETEEEESLRYQQHESEEQQHCEEWDQLLDGAGTWGSGEALLNITFSLWSTCKEEQVDIIPEFSSMYLSRELLVASFLSRCSLTLSRDSSSGSCIVKNMASHSSVSELAPICRDIPSDAHVLIFSFLHPKDVVSFACCDNASHQLVDNPLNDSSLHIWKSLWERDYAWLITTWPLGQKAHERETRRNRPIDKLLYFEFGRTYVNYLLAGHSTYESCLVGVHGNIYDISNFLEEHPGSPETLLAHAGRDATQTFEDANHTRTARAMSKSMCVTVDLFCCGGCGVRKAEDVPDFNPSRMIKVNRRQRRQPATLKLIRTRLQLEERKAKRKFTRLIPSGEALTDDINVYYNAFERRWKGWYIDTSLQAQYLESNE